MNWNAVGALAEVVGAVGVIASLLYLAIQIRNQNRESRLNTVSESTRQWNEVLGATATDRALTEIILRGLENFENLDPIDRGQFSSQIGRVFRVVEGLHKHRLEGRLDKQTWEAIERTSRVMLSYPGNRSWWQTRADWYSEVFQQYIKEVLGSAELIAMTSGENSNLDIWGKPLQQPPNQAIESDA